MSIDYSLPWHHREQSQSEWIAQLSSVDNHARGQAIDALRHIAAPDVTAPLFWNSATTDINQSVRCDAFHALSDVAYNFNLDSDLRAEYSGTMEQLHRFLSQAIDLLGSSNGQMLEDLIGFCAAMQEHAIAAAPHLKRFIDEAVYHSSRHVDEECDILAASILALGSIGNSSEVLAYLEPLRGKAISREAEEALSHVIEQMQLKCRHA